MYMCSRQQILPVLKIIIFKITETEKKEKSDFLHPPGVSLYREINSL